MEHDFESISKVLQEFVEVTNMHFGSYAYAAGALQIQLAIVLADLPASKQEAALSTLHTLTDRYSKA